MIFQYVALVDRCV